MCGGGGCLVASIKCGIVLLSIVYWTDYTYIYVHVLYQQLDICQCVCVRSCVH